MSSRSPLAQAAETLARADAAIDRTFAPHRKDPLVRTVGLISEVSDQPQLRWISAACIAAGLLGSSKRLARAGMRMLLAHELATMTKNFMKDEVDRTRPRSAQSMRDRKPKRGRSSAKEETSFPSGHTAGAVAVARAFSREFPEYEAPALGLAALVAAAQVPRCAHYLSDVGAGALVGLSAEAASNLVWQA